MPKMLADGDDRLLWVPDAGITNLSAPTVAELTAVGVVDLSGLVTKANFSLGATGNDGVADPALNAPGNDSAPGLANYEAVMDFFRWTTTGEDKAWTTFTGKGIHGFLVHRFGVPSAQTIATADKFSIYGAYTGTPQKLVPDNGGFRKFRLQFFVQSQEVRERAVAA